MTLKNDSSLKVWLPMNEGAGTTVYDYSGNATNGTLTNGPVWYKAKNGKNVVNIVDLDDAVTFAAGSSASISGNCSICMWVNFNTFPTSGNYGLLFSDWSGSYKNILFEILSTNKFGAITGDGSTSQNSTLGSIATIFTGQWYFVCYVRDATNLLLKIFINGVEDSSKIITYTGNTTNQTISIGSASFFCKVKDVFAFSRVLSVNEIKKLYEETYIE